MVVSTTTIYRTIASARSDCNCRCRVLFPVGLDLLCSARVARGAAGYVIVLETEIWPNFLREARRQDVPVLFVSGKISDRSFSRYQRYFGRVGFFLRPFLRSALGSASAFLMQSEKDAERIRALGAPGDRVSVSGNLKYDMELS